MGHGQQITSGQCPVTMSPMCVVLNYALLCCVALVVSNFSQVKDS